MAVRGKRIALSLYRKKQLGRAAWVICALMACIGVSQVLGDSLWAKEPEGLPEPDAAAAAVAAPEEASAPSPDLKALPRPEGEAEAEAALVYIPASGTRYHASATCSGMKSARAATVPEARGAGYTPCARCKPPE